MMPSSFVDKVPVLPLPPPVPPPCTPAPSARRQRIKSSRTAAAARSVRSVHSEPGPPTPPAPAPPLLRTTAPAATAPAGTAGTGRARVACGNPVPPVPPGATDSAAGIHRRCHRYPPAFQSQRAVSGLDLVWPRRRHRRLHLIGLRWSRHHRRRRYAAPPPAAELLPLPPLPPLFLVVPMPLPAAPPAPAVPRSCLRGLASALAPDRRRAQRCTVEPTVSAGATVGPDASGTGSSNLVGSYPAPRQQNIWLKRVTPPPPPPPARIVPAPRTLRLRRLPLRYSQQD